MSDGVLKFMFVVMWLNVFVLLEPFINKDGYRSMIFDRGQDVLHKVGFVLLINAGFLVFGMLVSSRL
jgi:hypothetical protein